MKALSIRESYKGADGVEKVRWNNIGVLFTAQSGKEFVKLNHIPNTLISVFEMKPKDNQAQGSQTQTNVPF